MRAPRRSKEQWEVVILERAAETFGRDGFAVPMSRLIEESGAPTGTYYRLFPDKSAVFARLLDDLHPEFVARVSERSSEGSSKERLGAMVAAMVELALTEYREVARLYLRDVRGAGIADDAARAADQRERTALVLLIEEGNRDGWLRCAHPDLAAIAIGGMVRKVIETYVLDDRAFPAPETVARELGQIAVLAAGGPPDGSQAG